jgi:hypothetical protein
MVNTIQDCAGNTYTSSSDVLRPFSAFLRNKYDISVDEENVTALMRDVNKTLPQEANLALDAPIKIDELTL